jgi:hypothetical protein
MKTLCQKFLAVSFLVLGAAGAANAAESTTAYHPIPLVADFQHGSPVPGAEHAKKAHAKKAYHPIPLIPGYMGGSPVPGAGAGDATYHPIPLIPGYMGGSPVPGVEGNNVARNELTRPTGTPASSPSAANVQGGAGVAH